MFSSFLVNDIEVVNKKSISPSSLLLSLMI